MAASSNVQTYASAQLFYSAGSTGLQILQQVFIADTSSLLNRALFSSMPDLPFLATVWIGPMIAAAILRETSWRWGYGMWTIILPAAFLPLALSLFLNQKKARRLNLLKPRPWKAHRFTSIVKRTWYDLDVFGLLLLSAGVALILVPLTLAANAKNTWKNSSIIAMIVIGGICLVVFPFWETSKRLAPHPLLSLHLLKQRTALVGCALAFFYFSKAPFKLFDLYFTPDLTFRRSGILLLGAALPLLLPSSRPGPICHHSRSSNSNLLFYINNIRRLRLIRNKSNQTIPTFRRRGLLHLHSWPCPHVLLQQRGHLHYIDIYHSNRHRTWCWPPQRPRPARCTSLCEPSRCRCGNSHVPHIVRNGWSGGISHLGGCVD